jgi:hypothetical protein
MSLKLLRDVPFGVVLCLVGADHINSANAQQTDQQTDQQTIVTKSGSGARRQDQSATTTDSASLCLFRK